MRSARRFFVGGLPVAIIAVVTVMLTAPAAIAWNNLVLVFHVQPVTTQVHTAMMPAVVVDVENPQGHLDSSFNGRVTLTYAHNPVGAPEPANNVVNAVDGVATFRALTFSVIGIGFKLKASAEQATSSPSQPFGIATTSHVVNCQPRQTCQSPTVSSDGTSGSAVASAAPTSDVLIASAGFPRLSCTKLGGVLSFTVQNRSKVIRLTLAGSVAQNANGKNLDICFGSPKPFITQNGQRSMFFPVDSQFEGLLPSCNRGTSPCVASQVKKCDGSVVATIHAPQGDPYISF